MDVLGDDELAALGLFEGHGALKGVDGDGRLIVGGRLGGDALEPEAGGGDHGHKRAWVFGGEADDFVAQADHHGDQGDARQDHGEHGGEGDERVDRNGEDHHHDQEAGSATRMIGGEALRIFDGDGLVRFEIEDHFVFGAEHKVVFNFESHQPVTVENAQRFTTYHPRCGTSFLIVMMILTIPVYALIPFTAMLPMILTRIALIPVVVGLSYEIIRFAAKHPGSLMAVITAPGLWLQRITTKPPADDQAAVAIHALQGAMALEESQGGELVIA